MEVHSWCVPDSVLAILINGILYTAGSDVRGENIAMMRGNREKAKVGQNMFHLVASPPSIVLTTTEFAGQIPAEPRGTVNWSASTNSTCIGAAF